MSKHKHNNELKNPTSDVSIEDYAAAVTELNELKRQSGEAPQEGRVSRFISSLFERRENRPKVAVNKKKLLWLSVLLGWCGGHRFYTKQYVLGAVYLLLCWTGFGAAMTIIDIMVYIPMQADEDGNILI